MKCKKKKIFDHEKLQITEAFLMVITNVQLTLKIEKKVEIKINRND